ncbi:MAG TPA: prolyl oligopeptidase family serine peptidase, partial [Mycobacteriales bacterium]|nr:prolyl oligopeptidase family serine peptidase [Mycobacteriales bacterium]
LEDPADPRTRAWAAAQDEQVRSHLADLPARDGLHSRLVGLLSAGVVGAPAWRGDRAFFPRREPGQEHPVLLMSEPDGTERTLLDPGAVDPTGLTTLDTWSVSPAGDRLAYQLSVGGDEESMLYVSDVDTGQVLEGPIDRCRYSAVAWLPSGQEYFYVRRLAPELVPAGEGNLHRRVYRHRVGADPDTDTEICGAGADPTTFYALSVSRDGRWLVVSANLGTAPRNDVWLADLQAEGGPGGPAGAVALREVQVGVDANTRAWVAADGRLYLFTDRDAPRGRLAVADPTDPGYPHWRDVVPEAPDAVLSHVALLTGADHPADGAAGIGVVLAAHSRDACDELSWYDPATGRRVGTVAGLDAASVTALTTRPEGGRQCWVGYTDFTTPPSVLRWSADTPERLTGWATAPGAPDLTGMRVTRTRYTSADGTVVHMFVLAAEAAPSRPRPAILYGYGGFNHSLTPEYSAMVAAWVAAGGVWATANLRGGSEHGEQWHRAGRRERKQNVFDDFLAAAGHLVDRGWTDRERLGIYGGSNGGLLVGAALTQRPDLFAAVVCSKPLMDMVRYEEHGLGRLWADEYGSAGSAEELAWLLGYSPYHRVRDGVAYPAVLFTTFESDTRVDPCHARKMCAALQHATSGDRPVLLRRELGVGHGARSVSRSADLIADQLAFMADQLGI